MEPRLQNQDNPERVFVPESGEESSTNIRVNVVEPQNNSPQPPASPSFEDVHNGDEYKREEYKSRSLSSQPYNTPQPSDLMQQPSTQPNVVTNPKSSRKVPKGPLIAGLVGGFLVIVLVAVALLASGNKTAQPEQEAPVSSQAQALQPAQSVEMEQANNSLNQNLSSLDDERDLPANSLDDTTLGL